MSQAARGIAPALALLCALLPLPTSGQSVQGVVLDADSKVPIPSARIELLRGEQGDQVAAAGLTDAEGRFLLRSGTPGPYRLRAGGLGFGTVVTSPFDLASGDVPLDVEVLLGVEAIPLAPLVIVSERPARIDLRLHTRGFYERQRIYGTRMGFGHFLDRDDIERRNPFVASDLLRGMPGVRIEGGGGRAQQITLRSSASLSRVTGSGGCVPTIYVDGVPAITGIDEGDVETERRDGRQFTTGTMLDDLVPASGIVGVEVYPGITQPPDFVAVANQCGTIVIWTGGGSGDGSRTWVDHTGNRSLAVELRVGSAVGAFQPTGSGLRWSPGLGVGAVVDWEVRSGLSLFVGAGREAFQCETGFCAGRGVEFRSIAWGPGLRGQLDVFGKPWVRLGALWHRLDTRWLEDGESRNMRSSGDLGFDGAAGLEIPLLSGFSVTPAVRHVRSSVSDLDRGPFPGRWTAPEDGVRVWTLGVGLRVARRF